MPDLPVPAANEDFAVTEPISQAGEQDPEPQVKEPEISRVEITGLLDIGPRDSGHLRLLANNFLPRASDVRVPFGLIDRHKLREGHMILGYHGPPRRGRRRGGPPRAELHTVLEVNGYPVDALPPRRNYADLISEHPAPRIELARTEPAVLSLRVVDLIAPVGRGQRGLIVASPRTGKTILLEQIGFSISQHYPGIHLIILLIDERPEEVTHMRRSVPKAQVVASTADSGSADHVRVARIVLEQARRLVEMKEDVVILLDSITRLGRAANREMRGKGRTMSGGIDSRALEFPRQFFGAARKIEDGGSLTILGTALVDTGSQMDEVIFQEFKGTGNMELVLDRKLAESRIFPAIDLHQSGTRREELLLSPEELPKTHLLRRALAGLKPMEAMSLLLGRMERTKNNVEMLSSIRVS
jgi:transcription termination factor Rho